MDTPTVSDAAPEAGASFTLSATVRNQGSGPSDSTTLRYYQSIDSSITTGDTPVDTDFVSRLDAAATGDESISLTAPPTPGTYYYGACVDSVSDEVNTVNNCSAAVTVTVSSSVTVPGAPTGLSTTAIGQTRIEVSWSAPSDDGGADILEYIIEISTDGSIWDNRVSSTATHIASTGLSSGTTLHYRVSAINSAGTGPASNIKSATTAPKPVPDLVVDMPGVSDRTPATGGRFNLGATVVNQGDGTADSTTLRYYQSSDSSITTGDTEVGTDNVVRLNESARTLENISLAAPFTTGTYYYGACVDSVSDEVNTGNNCSAAVTVTVSAGPAPDLVVSEPRLGSNALAAGEPFLMSATVDNQGSARSPTTTLRFYLSADSTISSSDTMVDTVSVVPLGAPGGYVGNIEPTAPSMAGTYYYGVCVDSVTGESDTTNNCSAAVAVTVVAPDLAVDTPTVSNSAPTSGASFTLNVTVRNQGSGRSVLTTLHYYQSTDSSITTGDTAVGTDEVYRLNGPADTYQSTSLTAPSTPGTYYYGACVDAVPGESDTTNNCSAAVTVIVGTAPAPDLVVDTPTVDDSSPTTRASFTLSATVRNQGDSNSSSTTLRYYRSNDSTINSSDTSVGTDSVSGLNVAGTSARSISLTAPATTGTYYYGACVDAVSDESDTTNNCSSAVAVAVGTAPAPDLVVDTPTVSESAPAAGAPFTLSATVRNQGSGCSDSTTLRFYQSTDPTITTGDTQVGTDSVGGFEASQTVDESITLTAPSTPGTYYYGACVDAVSGETATGNNCSSAVAVTVSAAPAAQKPGAPTGLTAAADSQTQIDLSWTAPQNDGGATVTGYRIEVSTDGSSWANLESNTGSATTSYSHTGLTAGSTRHYRVSAINSLGTGPVSNVDNATTDSQSNRAPVAVGTIPAWTSVPDGWEWIDVSSYFSDPDGDSLTYSAASSDPAVATSDGVLGSRVVIRVFAIGTATVTVTARDPGGLEATQTISVAVKYPNRRPESVGSIPSQTIVAGQRTSVDVSQYFRDPDSDLLSYRVTTSNVNAVRASVSGSTVNITGVSAAPLTWVTVTASDPDGLEAVQQIGVGVREAITMRLTQCFVFQSQHFARFKVTAHISVSSLVVKTYAVDSRNDNRHLMETTNIGNLSAGNSYEELTTRYFSGHLASYLTSCTVGATWN